MTAVQWFRTAASLVAWVGNGLSTIPVLLTHFPYSYEHRRRNLILGRYKPWQKTVSGSRQPLQPGTYALFGNCCIVPHGRMRPKTDPHGRRRLAAVRAARPLPAPRAHHLARYPASDPGAQESSGTPQPTKASAEAAIQRQWPPPEPSLNRGRRTLMHLAIFRGGGFVGR